MLSSICFRQASVIPGSEGCCSFGVRTFQHPCRLEKDGLQPAVPFHCDEHFFFFDIHRTVWTVRFACVSDCFCLFQKYVTAVGRLNATGRSKKQPSACSKFVQAAMAPP